MEMCAMIDAAEQGEDWKASHHLPSHLFLVKPLRVSIAVVVLSVILFEE